jgi:hypothetical protein
MQTIWKFTINGTEIDEPIGWDAVELTLQRSDNYHGLENVISDNIKFWGTGADIISEAYETYGIDAQLNFVINYSCDGGDTYTVFFSGILNCYSYSVVNNEVSIKIDYSDFQRTAKNRLDTPVNLNSNISIDGNTMSSIVPFDLHLHGKSILYVANMLVNDPIKTFNLTDPAPFNPPFTIIGTDISDITEMSSYQPLVALIQNNTSQTRTIHITGRIVVSHHSLAISNAGPTTYTYAGGFQVFAGTTLLYTAPYNGGSSPVTYDFTIDQTVTIAPMSSMVFEFFDYYANSVYAPLNSYSADWSFDSSLSNLTIQDVSSFNPSTTKAFLIHEVFAKIAESITGIQDSFRSDFFGRTNSSPHQYDQNGCGAWVAITNGLNIRKMLDKNAEYYPITASFNQVFQAADAIWNLGMRMEKDDSGKEYIRVEPKEYFYKAKTIYTALSVSDLKRSPAIDLIYNNFKIGYDKWNLNISGKNAIDEFNSTRTYNVPVKKADKTYQNLSKFIASGYVIEQTRRLQFNSLPTNDFETDNDLFVICTNIEPVTSSDYTTPPVSTTYPAGTISERNENFNSITNVLDAATNYNYRISPFRNAVRWYKYIGASVWKSPTTPIKFVSGDGNYQEGDTLDNGCISIGSVLQNQNLLASDITGEDANILFIPEYLEFTYPLTFDQFLNILDNSEKAIQVGCSSTGQYIGFIKSLKYGLTSDGWMGTFKLLRGQCIPGNFNEDFNNDFSIGNC